VTPEDYIDHHLDDIPGWFDSEDAWLFHWTLAWQTDSMRMGDLAELGVYLGRSAVLMGLHQQPGEGFTVCDLFDVGTTDVGNAAENSVAYPDLTRVQFLTNYGRYLATPPVVFAGPTSSLTGRVASDTFRFVHVDASHLWHHVVGDLGLAAGMLRPDGIVVCDDYRSAHTPGVAAATWAAVAEGLRPVALTASKFYGTWGDPEPLRNELTRQVADAKWQHETQQIAGVDVLRIPRLPEQLERRERLERALLPGSIKGRLDQRRHGRSLSAKTTR
jgi:hypothetical protein